MTIVAPHSEDTNRAFCIQKVNSVKDPSAEAYEVTWPDFVAFYTDVQMTDRPKMELPGYIPAKLSAPFRASKNVESVSVWVGDFDDQTTEQWQAVLERVDGLAHAWHSTYSHRSVSGEMCYRLAVRLDRPVAVQDWKRFHRALVKELGSSSDERCSDAARLYFAPFAPIDGPAPESGSGDGDALAVDEILASAPQQPACASSPAVRVTHADLRSVASRRLESVESVNTRAGYEGLIAALDGRPYAEHGNRDNTLLAMSGILARAFPHRMSEQIVAPIAHALDDAHPDMGAAALIAKLDRDLEKNKDERAAAGEKAPFSEAQRADIVRLAGAESEAALARQLIIDCERSGLLVMQAIEGADGSIAAIDYRPYSGRHAHTAIIAALDRFQSFPVALREQTREGTRLKPLPMLLLQYGQQMVEHKLSFEVAHAQYDHAARTLTEPAARVRSFGAYRDHELRTFLERSLGKAQLQALDHVLYNWRDLSKPSRALLLEGRTSLGKSNLYAAGLAQAWSDEGCTPFKSLFGFTGELRRSPVICADEEMPMPRVGPVLQQFKSLTGSAAQRVENKGVDAKSARGCLRYVFTANDGCRFMRDVLKGGCSADVEPILRRVLLLTLTPDAPDPGERLVTRVRDEHLFARYIEDLESRPRVPMPAGLPDLTKSWTDLTLGKDEHATLAAIEAYLFDEKPSASHSDGPAVHVDGAGQVWINVEALCAYSQQRSHLEPLKAHAVRESLKALGSEQGTRLPIGGSGGRRARYWPISTARLGVEGGDTIGAELAARRAATSAITAGEPWVPTGANVADRLRPKAVSTRQSVPAPGMH
jgi:hypothetical protein